MHEINLSLITRLKTQLTQTVSLYYFSLGIRYTSTLTFSLSISATLWWLYLFFSLSLIIFFMHASN